MIFTKFYNLINSKRKIINTTFQVLIGIATLAYIIDIIFFKNEVNSFLLLFFKIFSEPKFIVIAFVLIILMLINWFLEAVKWRLLILKLESVSVFCSIKSILIGIAAGMFTPNRVGELAGRVLMLKAENRWSGSILTLIGSIAQLLTTTIMFLIGIVYFFYLEYYTKESYFNFYILLFIIAGIIVLLIFIFINTYKISYKNSKFSKVKFLTESIKGLSRKSLIEILLLSILRYVVFSSQFAMLLFFSGLKIQFLHLYLLITLIYGFTTLIPTLALTEIGVKTTVSVWIFAWYINTYSLCFDNFQIIIVNCAFLLWTINIAIPALFGLFFLPKFKVLPIKK